MLIVADDGIGMEPEQVAALLQNEPVTAPASASRMSMTVCASTLARTTVSPLKRPYEGTTTVTAITPRVPEDREGDYDKNH